MLRKICFILLSLSLLPACSLNQGASASVTTLTIPSIDNTPTAMPTPTASPTEITSQPTLVPTSSPIPPTSASCTISRTDLPIYTVVAGDTLTNIASQTNSTVAGLVQINCLSDASQISVGQQLHVLNKPTQANNTNTPDDTQTVGTLVISSYLSTETADKALYHVQGDTVINLVWENMPSNQNIAHVELIYVDDHYTVAHVSVGIDTNIADGVSINWAIPNDVQGVLYAIGRIPGQHHLSVQSQEIYITSTSTPPQAIGAVSIDPNSQAGTSDDWSDYIIAPNTAVTIIWSGIDPEDFSQVGTAEFIYIPDYGDIQILGHDTDKSDGISLTWTTPATVLGKIDVSATYGNNSRIYAPRLHVRTE